MNLTPDEATDAPASPSADQPPILDHERLDVFRVALEFVALVPALTKAARPAFRDQIERASSSIALLVAEGNARRTRRDRHHFFSMAQGCWTSPLRGLVHLTGPADLASAKVRRSTRLPPVPSDGWHRGT